ncbi:MAG: metallophosphoesterase [Deltaproteobacteria bacterium]|nr:metallophosphoesterase [Deltaproteobacteria bacterium]
MFSLGHLSDLHATPVVVRNPLQLLNKRFFGWLSWQIRRRHYHRTSVLDALLEDLHRAPIDHLVVTGDLTNLSLVSEFSAAREGLKRLGDARDVSIVPGNHDAYVRVARARSWNLWSEYFESDAVESAAETSDPRDRFPTLRIRGPLAVVGLCSALPTRLFDASGTLGDAQLDRLERTLRGLAERDLCRVISIHHPVTVGATHSRRWLRDAESLRNVITRAGADLVVHGHNHRTLIEELAGPDGAIPVVGVRSASDFGQRPERRAQYHIYEIERNGAGDGPRFRISLRIRGYDRDSGRFRAEDERVLVG